MKNARKTILAVCAMSLCLLSLMAQSGIRITGTVSDDTGLMPGVTVVIRGNTTVGTTTDANGE